MTMKRTLLLAASVGFLGVASPSMPGEENGQPKDAPGAEKTPDNTGAKPTPPTNSKESLAEAWGPKEIRDLEDQAHKLEPELMKMSPAELKKWLTIDEHGRNSYKQLKMLSIIGKTFTRKEWESIFGNSAIEGQFGIIGWSGHLSAGKMGLVEYIVPWTGNVRMLDAAHGRKEKSAYILAVP